MNEKGFATIFGLCLILAIALVVKGIQESEMNHAYETSDFQTEFELQNLADSGIYRAVDAIKEDHLKDTSEDDSREPLLPFNRIFPALSNAGRNDGQGRLIPKPGTIKNTDSINLEVWGERIFMNHYERQYPSYDKVLMETTKKAYVLFSWAEVESKQIYRRAFAYVLFNEDGTSDSVIHFMELPSEKDE